MRLKAGKSPEDGPLRADAEARVKRWRAMARTLAEENPDWDLLQIARKIQGSAAGKRKGGVLPYTITAIVKYIRMAVVSRNKTLAVHYAPADSESASKMSERTRILMVEDNAADAELSSRELRRANINIDPRRVDTVADYGRELEAFRPHLILCDFSMPKFDGLEALRIARHSYPDVPFIFVSGTIGEESAILALKNGATDYVLKGNLLRLPAAVQRAIKETEERRIRRAHERQLRSSEKLFRTLFESSQRPTMIYDAGTLRFVAVNNAAVARYGYSRDEFSEMTINDLLLEADRARFLDAGQPLPMAGNPQSWQHRTKSGELVEVQLEFHDLVVDGRQIRVIAG